MSTKIETITNHMKTLSELYMKQDDSIRAGTFTSALTKINERYPDGILPDDLNELREIKGIGPSTVTEIRECLETGTSKRLEELKSKLGEVTVDARSSKDKLAEIMNKRKMSS